MEFQVQYLSLILIELKKYKIKKEINFTSLNNWGFTFEKVIKQIGYWSNELSLIEYKLIISKKKETLIK